MAEPQARVVAQSTRMSELLATRRPLTDAEVTEMIRLKKLEQARKRVAGRRAERTA